MAELASMAGMPPDPEQEFALDMVFALRESPDERERLWPAMTSFAVIAPRQNLKTGLLKMCGLGWLFITDEAYTVWSAHETSTSHEAFLDLARLIENTPRLSKRLPINGGLTFGRGTEKIQLKDRGPAMVFKARTKTGGRGLTGNRIVLDEAFALTEDMVGAIAPVTAAIPGSQILYASSAGMASSVELRSIRDRGRSGASPRLGYLEWCAPRGECASENCQHPKPSSTGWKPGCQLDDVALLGRANPLLGRVRANGTGLTLEKLQDFREEMSPHQFAREFLGWWDESAADEVFGPGNWEVCQGEIPSDVSMGALGLAATLDLKRACLTGAGQAGERMVVVPLQHGDTAGDWLMPRVIAEIRAHQVPVVVDGHGPGAVLVPELVSELKEAKLNPDKFLIVTTTPQVLDACADIHRLVVRHDLLHANYPELDTAVAGAFKRDVGDRWAWGRRASVQDITPVESMTLAAWGAKLQATAPPPEIF
ncbi:hypothetical protein HJ590_13210 [Naumannella sp. ID2617S]|nr:hypothetical protein [Naumannella sp. ID2617S]